MAKITTPVKGFTGTVVGVSFTDGVAETDNAGAIAYFTRKGYGVEQEPQGPAFPEGTPDESWKGPQLKAYAKAKDITLGGAKKVDEILTVILEHLKQGESMPPTP